MAKLETKFLYSKRRIAEILRSALIGWNKNVTYGTEITVHASYLKWRNLW